MFLGRTCTLKIYNKYLEFIKHDKQKLIKINADKMHIDNEFNVNFFDILEYENKIRGYLRFELEIHKRMLQNFYGEKEININKVNYSDLLELWKVEFMKLYSFKKEDNISNRIKIKKILCEKYGDRIGNPLYNFYLRIVTEGESYVKNSLSKSTFYRNKKRLQDVGIDFSKRFNLVEEQEECSYIALNFNPFTCFEREVS